MMSLMIHMKELINTKTVFSFFMDLIMYAMFQLYISKSIIFMYFDINKSLIIHDNAHY